MLTSSGSTVRRGRDAKTIISPNNSVGDIIIVDIDIVTNDTCCYYVVTCVLLLLLTKYDRLLFRIFNVSGG